MSKGWITCSQSGSSRNGLLELDPPVASDDRLHQGIDLLDGVEELPDPAKRVVLGDRVDGVGESLLFVGKLGERGVRAGRHLRPQIVTLGDVGELQFRR